MLLQQTVKKIIFTMLLLGMFLFSFQALLISKASAYTGWSTVYDYGGSVSLVCKTYMSSGYGPVWKVTIASLSSPGTYSNTLVRIYRTGGQTGELLVSAQNGQWKLGYMYGSVYFNDSIWAMGSSAAGATMLGTYGGGYSISNIATCG